MRRRGYSSDFGVSMGHSLPLQLVFVAARVLFLLRIRIPCPLYSVRVRYRLVVNALSHSPLAQSEALLSVGAIETAIMSPRHILISFGSVVNYPDALQLCNRYYWYSGAFLSRYEITDSTVDVSKNSIRYLDTATKC